MTELPSGTVTFLFTDVEGSTKLLHELGAEAYAEALAEHRRAVRQACASNGGVEVDTQGDAFFFAFPTAPGALGAAGDVTEALAPRPIRVRIGLHTGTPLVTEEGYVGPDVHRAARIAAAGHGGQVLVSSSTASLVDLELRDLGEHRFKDLGAAERVYQLGDGDFPALKSLYRTNLPVPATPFLGRERELAEVVELLGREDVRLLTLTGPGGTGKTRLAAQAAGLASGAYPDGIWWVPLASLRDPQLVLESAAQVLGVKGGLAEHIAGQRLLCLFDNFERVIDASADLGDLLVACPNLKLIATSREPLHLSGEHEYPVPPFAHEEGVGFFLARALTVKPDFQANGTVSEICRRLDDLPLALELAAARARALSAAKILERLDQSLPLLTGGARDAPERQRTLRATIEWSHELLTPEEQRLFACLSVFGGGCTLEAAEQVAEADLDTLQSLVEKSLLRFTNERYWMLETIREFARERFEESAEITEVRARHAAWAADVVERHQDLRFGNEEALASLEAEHDNIRAALAWLLEAGDAAAGLRLTGGDLSYFWWVRGYIREAHGWLEAFLSAEGPRPPEVQAKALTRISFLAAELDPVKAIEYGDAAVAMWTEIGDVDWIVRSLNGAGNALWSGERFDEAVRYFDEAIAHATNSGLHEWLATLSANKAGVLLESGEEGRARTLLVDALGRARDAGSRIDIAAVLPMLGILDALDGRPEAASELCEALTIEHELGFRVTLPTHLSGLAAVAAGSGFLRNAVLLASAAEAIEHERGERPGNHVLRARERALVTAREGLAHDEYEGLRARGSALELDEAIEIALTMG
jgi:predicted ATPase/class 3 adenylate cyclase